MMGTNIVPYAARLDPVQALRSSSKEGPEGFDNWLEKHLELHDPIVHAPVSASAATSPTTRPRSNSSYRCWFEQCVHFVYGFSSQYERDSHARIHSTYLSKRDSGLSITTPPLIPRKNTPGVQSSVETVRPAPPARQVRSAGSSHLPTLSLQTQTRDRDRKDPVSFAYSYPNSRPGTRGASVESDVDSQLPPLKRNRAGHSRLQSIGELQLLRDNDPCLRCKVSHRAVSIMQSCLADEVILTDAFGSATLANPAPFAWNIPQPARRNTGEL